MGILTMPKPKKSKDRETVDKAAKKKRSKGTSRYDKPGPIKRVQQPYVFQDRPLPPPVVFQDRPRGPQPIFQDRPLPSERYVSTPAERGRFKNYQYNQRIAASRGQEMLPGGGEYLEYLPRDQPLPESMRLPPFREYDAQGQQIPSYYDNPLSSEEDDLLQELLMRKRGMK